MASLPRLIDAKRDGPVSYLWLNRPEVRNAIDERLIDELTGWAAEISASDARVAVLAGHGPAFCAGADLGWMARAATQAPDVNRREATAMATMYEALDHLPIPLIGRVHGAALGGGAGLVAVCDVVVAEEGAVFGFSEVRLGILPALVSHHVVAKAGMSATRELFLTGRRFDAHRARDIGLVHAVVSAEQLAERVDYYVREVLRCAPGAIAATKRLIREVVGRPEADTRGVRIDAMAKHRTSEEGREGMRAFLDKRRPVWDGSDEPPR